MRLIDIEAINWYDDLFMKGVNHSGVWVRYRDVEHLIRNAPTVDAEPVVRCKDCRWWQLSLYNTCGIHVCQRFSGVRGEHDFCSRGEHREEEHDEGQ